MQLFIQIKDGLPFEHPVVEDNIKQIIKDFDFDNPPEGWAKFVRKPRPDLGVYEVYTGVTYVWNGDMVEDSHITRPMTEQEKQEKINLTHSIWAAQQGHASWTFNEALCAYVPPVQYPNDGKRYYWDEPTLSWIEIQQ